MSKWYIVHEGDWIDENDQNWTITTNEKVEGWKTNSGYPGYGLPKELAQWIVDQLNKVEESPPFLINYYGYWEKNE